MLWIALAAIGGLIIGFVLGTKAQASLMRDGLRVLAQNQAGDRAFLLSVLRRELANWLLRRDPDRFLKTYQRAHDEMQQLLRKGASVQRAQFKVLCDKYPMYVDFDFIGTREHVLYGDALAISDIDDVERHYVDLIAFQTLLQALDVNWRNRPASREDDLKHLSEYVQRVKDTRFKRRLDSASLQFHAYERGEYFARDGAERKPGEPLFVTSEFSVHHAYDVAGTSRGYHFNDTDEYGVESTFHDTDRSYRSVARSNATFEKDGMLHDIHMDDWLEPEAIKR